VEVQVIVELGDLGREVVTARERIAAAQRAQKDAAEWSRAAAQHLREAGLSVSDSAFVMGLSRGRVSQLVG